MVSALPSPGNGMRLGRLWLFARLVAGGDTLSGRVVARDGHAVAGATVVVVELHRVALTQTDGQFRFPDMPAGSYPVTVRRLGFAPLARQVSVAASTTLDLTLEQTSVWVEPVTVTATRAPLDVFSSPLPTEALSEARLRRAQSVSLAHALAELPGINALSTGQQIGKPVIRGLAGPRVLVLEDGSRLEDYSWSDEDGPSVDARLAQRVEVIRGPASVLYGSDALGGVVNVIPEELPDANGGPRAMHTGFEISGASNNAELEGAARVEGASGGWGWRLFGIGRFASSLHTPAGELDNTGFSALSGEAAVGTRGPRGSTTLRYTRYGGEFKLLEAEGPASGASGFYQTNDTRGRIPLVPAARAGAAAVFDFEEVGLGRVSVLAGGRVDVRRLAADANAALGRSDETRDYTALSGTLGVVYRPAAAVALTANLGRAWRAPTLFELFANGAHLGEARYEIGDAGLKPEAGTNLDVS